MNINPHSGTISGPEIVIMTKRTFMYFDMPGVTLIVGGKQINSEINLLISGL